MKSAAPTISLEIDLLLIKQIGNRELPLLFPPQWMPVLTVRLGPKSRGWFHDFGRN